MHKSSVINHIVNFTSQRDKDLLIMSFLKSIKGMIQTSNISILFLNNKDIPILSVSYNNNSCVKQDDNLIIEDEIMKSISHMNNHDLDEYFFKKTKVNQYIRTIENNRKGSQYVLIELTDKPTKSQSYILDGILAIYRNFTELLAESQTDELTGLANRKTFDSSMNHIFDNKTADPSNVENERRSITKAADSLAHVYWIAILDIDDFKKINDNYGHLYGDEILIHLSQIIKQSFREADLKFRFGGEEFVVILKCPNKEQCADILERFRIAVADFDFPSVGQVTVSIGATEFKKDVFNVTLLDYADQAMYFSKKKGKNCLNFFEDMVENGDYIPPEDNSGEEGEIVLF